MSGDQFTYSGMSSINLSLGVIYALQKRESNFRKIPEAEISILSPADQDSFWASLQLWNSSCQTCQTNMLTKCWLVRKFMHLIITQKQRVMSDWKVWTLINWRSSFILLSSLLKNILEKQNLSKYAKAAKAAALVQKQRLKKGSSRALQRLEQEDGLLLFNAKVTSLYLLSVTTQYTITLSRIFRQNSVLRSLL